MKNELKIILQENLGGKKKKKLKTLQKNFIK
jgi:hypothetical protein